MLDQWLKSTIVNGWEAFKSSTDCHKGWKKLKTTDHFTVLWY